MSAEYISTDSQPEQSLETLRQIEHAALIASDELDNERPAYERYLAAMAARIAAEQGLQDNEQVVL